MKLTLPQLSGHLTQQLAPIYVLASPEPPLLQEAIQLIRTKAEQTGFNERHWFCPTQQQDWEQIALLQSNLDMFSQKQIIEIFLSNGKLGKHGSQQLQNFVKQISANNLLIISTDKLDKTITNSTWLNACADVGVFIPMWPSAPPEQQTAINDYVKQITSGQFAQSVNTLKRLEENDAEPTWIIWQLAQHLRKLIQMNARGNYTQLLQKVGELEVTVKSFTTDSWTALRQFTYEIVIKSSMSS
jgi:DNA polymerase III delta subunit